MSVGKPSKLKYILTPFKHTCSDGVVRRLYVRNNIKYVKRLNPQGKFVYVAV